MMKPDLYTPVKVEAEIIITCPTCSTKTKFSSKDIYLEGWTQDRGEYHPSAAEFKATVTCPCGQSMLIAEGGW